jgi:hypothetical protein
MYGIYDDGQIVAQFVAPMTVRSNHPVFASDAMSLNRLVARRTAQRWEISTRLEPLVHTAHYLMVLMVTQGYHDLVQVIVPQNYGVIMSRTSDAASPTISGVQNASIATVGSNTGLIPRGTFIKITGHDKVYMTTSDRDGNGSVGIYPPLRLNVGATFQHLDNVQMTCKWDLDTVSGMTYVDGIIMDPGVVTLVEDV